MLQRGPQYILNEYSNTKLTPNCETVWMKLDANRKMQWEIELNLKLFEMIKLLDPQHLSTIVIVSHNTFNRMNHWG